MEKETLQEQAERIKGEEELLGIEIVITRGGAVVAQKDAENFEIAEQNLESLRRQFEPVL